MARSSILAAVLATTALLSGGPSSRAASDPRIDRSPEFTSRVNAGIDAGVAWLKRVRAAGDLPDHPGQPGAVPALVYCTLRVCGVPAEDPIAASVFSSMKERYASARRSGMLRTYAAALYCMALAEHGDERLGADPSGERLTSLCAEDAAWMRELVFFLENAADARGRWSYGGDATRRADGRVAGMYDNSNTQYALLGLKAASRAGVKAKAATWTKALKHFLDVQERTGPAVTRYEPDHKGRTSARAVDRARGWTYYEEGPAYGSMTAGGVGSVVICRSELLGTKGYSDDLDAKADQSARDGLAWLGENFDVAVNPGPGMRGMSWLHYYLYAMERAGVLASVDWMGRHDWYGEGAEFLLGQQRTTGAWTGGEGVPGRPSLGDGGDPNAIVTTCFALLFLKRGTPPVARGALTSNFDDTDINFAVAPSLSDRDFEDFLDVVLSRWRRSVDAATAERILSRATAVGTRIVAPLILRLDSTRDEEREAAFALLAHATGLEHGYDPHASRENRETAVAKWQSWWFANGDRLRFDKTAGRLLPAH